MGFLSTETFEDVERVRRQREREKEAMIQKELENNPPGRYVVLRKLNTLGWDVVHETRNGIEYIKAKAVVKYKVDFCEVSTNKLLIVKVED